MKGTAGFAAINGARLWFEATGAGPLLILIHGDPLDARMWEPQIDALSTWHRVIRYDVRGYGRSAPPQGDSYRHEDDLAGLLACLAIDRAAVLGASMGGRLAVDFALAYPVSVAALILVGPSLSGFPWTEDVVALSAAVSTTWREAGAEAAKRLVMGRHWFQTAQPQPAVTHKLAQMIGDYSGWHWLHEDPVAAPHPPAYERLEAIAAPTLAIVGEHDHRDIHQVAEALARRVPGVRCETFPGAGHMVNMEQPEQFNMAVLDFLARLPGAATAAARI